MLAAFGVPVAAVAITSRTVFASASGAGLIANGVEPDGKPATEMRALWRIIEKELSMAKPKASRTAALAQKSPAAAETAPASAAKPAKPDDGRITTSLTLSRETLAELKVLAVHRRVRVNDVILEAIANHLSLNGRRAAA